LEARVFLEVGVARRHIGQHAQRDLVGIGQVGQPGIDRVVEGHHLLVDESQQQRRHIRDRDGTVAEVHLRRRRQARHRLAQRFGDDLLPVDEHAHDDGLDVLLVHDVARDGDNRFGLITRRTRHWRRLAPRCGIGGGGTD
jgi:hypothetical protein